ncbi:scd2/ral3 [Xylariomycetidae sp. FL0641]|nr:scd2/ral3 [Xylariomycetidae sp. FL0641]
MLRAHPNRDRDSLVSTYSVTYILRPLQALRRSIKGEKEKGPQVSIAPKSAVAIVPPKKVIRALYNYEAQSSQELSFSQGDFFHVIGRENDNDWYEACNPALPDARGLVPVAFFQALGRTERDSGSSDSCPPRSAKKEDHDSGFSEANHAAVPPTPTMGHRSSKSAGKNSAMVYGIVMYDFQAMRADELMASAGENIIIIAQSNPEWFVAKPITRLGGPGLIPVSYVEIRDMVTNTPIANPEDAIRRAGIPRVEEWKKMAAEYKNSSITLGKFGGEGVPEPPLKSPQQPQSLQQGMERLSLQQDPNRHSQQQGSPYSQQEAYPSADTGFQPDLKFAPVSAQIVESYFDEGTQKYWFVIKATLRDGIHYNLFRHYEDFYELQTKMLRAHDLAEEAGMTGKKRTIPYMPGPVSYVNDEITQRRLGNLNQYFIELLDRPEKITTHEHVRAFFQPTQGDEVDPNYHGEEYRLSAGSRSSTDSPRDGYSRQPSGNNLNGNGYGGLSAAPRQMQNGQPQMSRQTSSVSQPSQTSLSPGINQAPSSFKVKMFFNGDTFLIRVPSDTNFQQLYEKIRERTKVPSGEQIELFYRDEQSGDKLNLMSNNDLNYALDHNEKLVIFVEQV